MRTTSRLFRATLIAGGLLAISASAAQAMPTGSTTARDRDPLGFTAARRLPPAHQLAINSRSAMQGAVDSPADQAVPVVIAQPAPPVTRVVDGGFGWTDAGIGAAVSALLLILAAVAATRVRPRPTVHL
jgi:hypothetical protein